MSALERLLASIVALMVLSVAGWFGLQHYGTKHYDAGYAAAVEAGAKLRQAEADRHQREESDLRDKLAAADYQSFEKEQEYAANLANAQRRVLTGTDRLRCHTASAAQRAAPAGDRSATAGPALDRQGAELVPDAAAALLGDGATVAGIVRKFDRLEQRFEECRAMNAN